MILARLSNAIRTQNWFAVMLEFVIVIAGVVIGFQITMWASDRSDAEAGDDALASLIEETAQSIEHMEGTNALYGRVISRQERAVAALSEGALPSDLSHDEFVEAIGLVRFFTPPEPPRSAYDALIATGDIRLIADQDALEALSRYYAVLTTQQMFIARIYSAILFEQPGYHPAIRSVYDPERPDGRRRLAEFDTLVADPGFIEDSVDMLRANNMVQNRREEVLEEARRLLDALCEAAKGDQAACHEEPFE